MQSFLAVHRALHWAAVAPCTLVANVHIGDDMTWPTVPPPGFAVAGSAHCSMGQFWFICARVVAIGEPDVGNEAATPGSPDAMNDLYGCITVILKVWYCSLSGATSSAHGVIKEGVAWALRRPRA